MVELRGRNKELSNWHLVSLFNPTALAKGNCSNKGQDVQTKARFIAVRVT